MVNSDFWFIVEAELSQESENVVPHFASLKKDLCVSLYLLVYLFIVWHC